MCSFSTRNECIKSSTIDMVSMAKSWTTMPWNSEVSFRGGHSRIRMETRLKIAPINDTVIWKKKGELGKPSLLRSIVYLTHFEVALNNFDPFGDHKEYLTQSGAIGALTHRHGQHF